MSDHWNFITPSEFMSSAPDPDWIIDQVLTVGTELHLYGRDGAGKSRLAWQLAHSIGEGLPLWLDAFKICKKGRVLWLGVDMESNEMKALLCDAQAAEIWTDNLVLNEHRIRFRFHEPSDRKQLVALNEKYDPLLVIVDNASQTGFKDLSNEEIWEYLWVFRNAFPSAGKVHLNHTRRLTQEMKARGKEDTEGYLGGGEWARGTRCSIHLLGSYASKTGKLRITKLRGILPYVTLDIKRDSYGFWHVQEQSVALLLATWPHCLPEPNGHSATSVRGVCRSIADAYPQHKAEAVRSQYKREKDNGVRYDWEGLITDTEFDTPTANGSEN